MCALGCRIVEERSSAGGPRILFDPSIAFCRVRMRPQVIAHGDVVSPQRALPFDDGEIRGVSGPPAEVLSAGHTGFSQVFVTKGFKRVTILEGERPLDQTHQNINDGLRSQAHHRGASEVLYGLNTLCQCSMKLRRIVCVPIRPPRVVDGEINRFVDIGSHVRPGQLVIARPAYPAQPSEARRICESSRAAC